MANTKPNARTSLSRDKVIPRICATRALKNAKLIRKAAPQIIPPREPLEGFRSLVPLDILERFDRMSEADLRDYPELLKVKRRLRPRPAKRLHPALFGAPPFKGTLHFVQMTFSIANGSTVAVGVADVATAIEYATLAAAPISAYASQYGSNHLEVSPVMLQFRVDVENTHYNDDTLQKWVNRILDLNHLRSDSSCIIILNPPGMTNTDGARSDGIGGYHDQADSPYCFVNLFGTGLTISDTQDFYADTLSHEIAEMTCDPDVSIFNDEVCDGCAGNCHNSWRNFFGPSPSQPTAYITSSKTFPPAFPFNFFVASIVRRSHADDCPAPDNACAYGPPIHVGKRESLFLADRNGGIYTALGDPNYEADQGDFAGFGRWRSVSEGSSTPGGPVTAVPWGNNIALFLADRNGGIYTALGDPNYEADQGDFAGFRRWRSVSEGSSTPGGPVTAVPWGNNIALFLADRNGGIYTALGDPNYEADHGDFAGFRRWRSVSEGSSTPGGPVTAVPWGNNIALFLADRNGGIYTALGDPNYEADQGDFAGFGRWRSVSEGSSTPGGPVTAVPWGNNIALFLADRNGGIYTALGDPNYEADQGDFAGFRRWRSVSEGSSTPGGPVTAVPWGNNIALFLADRNGGIYTALGDPNYEADHGDFAGFRRWRSVSEGSSTPGGPVTAVPWGNNIALFLADRNGGIYTALGDPNYEADHGDFAGFRRWRSVSEGSSTPGAPVAAVG